MHAQIRTRKSNFIVSIFIRLFFHLSEIVELHRLLLTQDYFKHTSTFPYCNVFNTNKQESKSRI
jgi:hypothetical protein